MRFPRHAKIFRGQLDPAPVAGVFFLLPIFLLLGSLLYTPGVLIDLGKASADSGLAKPIAINRAGEISFDGKIYKATNDLPQLRADLKNFSAHESLVLQPESGAPQKVILQIREMMRIDLPLAENLPGTENPTAVVAVNLRGQYFYENQMVEAAQLKVSLKNKIEAGGAEMKNLTLVLLADRAVENETLLRLELLAREVGIKQVLVATRPGVFSTNSNSLRP